jgi:transcriptional regulator with XRE-family HTH domain
MTDANLDVFVELNQTGKKVPWQRRVKLVEEIFPSTTKLDWNRAFSDIDLLGRVLRDILKVDQTEPGRSGPRPVLDRARATARLRQFMGKDYTELSFPDALRVLANGRSVRGIAAKTGLDVTMVQRLLTGGRFVDVPIMEQVALAYKKDPSYFMEFRVMYILAALADRMDMMPEMTVDLYKRIRAL